MMQQCCHLHRLARSMLGDVAGRVLVPAAAAVQATEVQVGVLLPLLPELVRCSCKQWALSLNSTAGRGCMVHVYV
jgi:hypothetical protein